MASEISIFNPETLAPPLGQYHHVTRVRASEFLFIAGMLAVDIEGRIVGESDFEAQCAQVFANIEAALKAGGAVFSDVVQFTTYMVHSQHIETFMEFRKREFPSMFSNAKYPPEYLAHCGSIGSGRLSD